MVACRRAGLFVTRHTHCRPPGSTKYRDLTLPIEYKNPEEEQIEVSVRPVWYLIT